MLFWVSFPHLYLLWQLKDRAISCLIAINAPPHHPLPGLSPGLSKAIRAGQPQLPAWSALLWPAGRLSRLHSAGTGPGLNFPTCHPRAAPLFKTTSSHPFEARSHEVTLPSLPLWGRDCGRLGSISHNYWILNCRLATTGALCQDIEETGAAGGEDGQRGRKEGIWGPGKRRRSGCILSRVYRIRKVAQIISCFCYINLITMEIDIPITLK